MEQVTGSRWEQDLAMISKGVHVEVPWDGEYQGQHVWDGHPKEDDVGRSDHVLSWQDNDDQGVCYDRQDQEERHDVSKDDDRILDRNLATCTHKVLHVF